MSEPTYVFQNGKVFAIVEGKVVASGADLDEVEFVLAAEEADTVSKTATHVTTPNGLKGQILGRERDVWGETVTIRFENGRIASYHTALDGEFDYSTEEATPVSKVASLQERIDSDYSPDEDSLKQRLAELKDIRSDAALLVAKASHREAQELDELIVTAEHEAREIGEVLAHIDAQKGDEIGPIHSFRMEAVEQESLGGGDSSWLDDTVGEMIAEAESTDFDQLMNEGPESLVADLDDAAIAEAGTVRSMASQIIRSKTAGIDPSAVEKFEAAFLARAEQVRRQELLNRKQTIAKQAASDQDNFDGPAEGLFF